MLLSKFYRLNEKENDNDIYSLWIFDRMSFAWLAGVHNVVTESLWKNEFWI
jgi:hypothetical protein